MSSVHASMRRLDTDVYTLALQRIATIADRFDHLAVSFSGGKDSTAVLNLTLEVLRSDPARWSRHLPLRVIFFDEEAIPYETEAYARRVAAVPDVALEWYCLPVRHRNACSRTSPWWWPWSPEDRDRWCRPLPPEAITDLPGFPTWPAQQRPSMPDSQGLWMPPRLGNTITLMGIRATESLTRRRAVSRRERELNYVIPFTSGYTQGNCWKGYPIYDWLTADVWTAPKVKGWDYNRAYDLMEMAGIPHSLQRCSPAFGEEPLQKLWVFATCFPDVWEKMTGRVPGVGAAHRYGTTELYAYKDRPAKPAGMLWPDFVIHYVRQFLPGDSAALAGRLRDEIRLHYRRTSTPIPVHTRHPETGVSWEWLLMVAMRGDMKKRKVAAGEVYRNDPIGHARRWRTYLTELHQLTTAGLAAELAHPRPIPSPPWQLMPTEYAQILTEQGETWPPPPQ